MGAIEPDPIGSLSTWTMRASGATDRATSCGLGLVGMPVPMSSHCPDAVVGGRPAGRGARGAPGVPVGHRDLWGQVAGCQEENQPSGMASIASGSAAAGWNGRP